MVQLEEFPIDCLAGQHILLVEDEILLALDMADEFERAGGDVEMAATARKALHLIRAGHFDCAILDFRIGDGTSLPVAAELAARGVPFFFVTAQGELPELRQGHPDAKIFSKPMMPHLMRRELEKVLQRSRPQHA
ncbi:response regulator [Lutibaculum baratangense]|uniref:Putative phytochrome/sensor histidine kinase n=1 Tax=Lutibaculum baratangense AMV1 TaxID=631454 RepID=V4QTL0_9HYPH|nr:response regulator [Lutibaculum baratangense]ESR23097.1 putative phytochrome/sensor histidine kinase [Lutibaculum baratangense AMV1]